MTNMNTPPTRQPALYIPHGAGPCFFMDWNPPDAWDATAAYLRSIAGSAVTRRYDVEDWIEEARQRRSE